MADDSFFSWLDTISWEDNDVLSSDESPYSSSLSSSFSDTTSSDDKGEESFDEDLFYTFGNQYDIVSNGNLNRFIQNVDRDALMEEQAAHIVCKLADAFVKDVCMRVIKLANYRNGVPSALDVKFILMREYNITFSEQ